MEKIADFFKGFAHILSKGKTRDKVIGWIIVAMALFFIGSWVFGALSPDTPKSVNASELITQLENGNVEEMHISNIDGSVDGKFKEPNEDGITAFKSEVPERSEAFTERYLAAADVDYDFRKPSALVALLENLLLIIVQVGLIVIAMAWLLNMSGAGLMEGLPFGNSSMELKSEIPDASFDDVAGLPEAIEEVSEIVAFLKDGEKYQQAGADFPKGILMSGPPGCGKTLLARCLAGEAGVPFLQVSGSDFVEMYVGVGAKRVRAIFEKAREVQPSILFIDEIDAIGGSRDESQGTHDERLQTLNQLLKEMDGFDKKSQVIVIAATNRAQALDRALIRPGRFDRTITVDTPAKEGRIEILKHYAQGRPFAEQVDFEQLAAHTYGFSGAELANVMNQAATLAARRSIEDGSDPMITKADLDEGISRTIAGPAMKSKQMNDEEKRQVAYHEAGHALVQYLLPDCDEVQKISIVSRHMPDVGMAMGYVQSYSEEDSYVTTSAEMTSEIAALLAGRCSEKMYCNIESAGAYDDLMKASRMAYEMVDTCAFNIENKDKPPLRVAVRDKGTGFIKASEKRLEYVDEQVDVILERGYATAKRLLAANRRKIETIVSVLLDEEVIDADRIRKIMEDEEHV